MAVKRSKLGADVQNYLASANSIGNSIVNFDAEYDIPDIERYLRLGYRIVETIQTSGINAETQIRRVLNLLEKYRNLYANLVVGNAAYGCSGNFRTLERTLERFRGHASRIKVGAEGVKNGGHAIELCRDYGAVAYLLQNQHTLRLLESAKQHGVLTAMYSIARFGENREKALKELVEITGNGYFNRRGINDLEIGGKAELFCMFGSEDDMLEQMKRWRKEGVGILVFNLASKDLGDYAEQINKLNRMLR